MDKFKMGASINNFKKLKSNINVLFESCGRRSATRLVEPADRTGPPAAANNELQ